MTNKCYYHPTTGWLPRCKLKKIPELWRPAHAYVTVSILINLGLVNYIYSDIWGSSFGCYLWVFGYVSDQRLVFAFVIPVSHALVMHAEHPALNFCHHQAALDRLSSFPTHHHQPVIIRSRIPWNEFEVCIINAAANLSGHLMHEVS